MHSFQNPLISIITVCYNSEKTIEKTLNSVLNQTYENYQYIVVDGKSTDKTLEIIDKYRTLFKEKLLVISEKDTGIYNAINKGIRKSKGKIIGILNSDDYYSIDTLEIVANKYEKEKYPFLIIFGNMMRVSSSGKEIYTYHFTEKQIKQKQCFGHPSMFAARAVYDRIGLYDETYKLAADGEWQYRAYEDNIIRYLLCSEIFNHMCEGGASDNRKYRWKWFHERVRMKKIYKKESILKIYWQEFKSVIRTDIKAIIPRNFEKYFYKIKYNGIKKYE